MLKKVTIRIHDDIHQELIEESRERRISLTDLLREIILQRRIALNSNDNQDKLKQEPITQSEQKTSNAQETNLVEIETLFLLRAFVLDKSGQSYSKAQDMMTKKFGNDWKKI